MGCEGGWCVYQRSAKVKPTTRAREGTPGVKCMYDVQNVQMKCNPERKALDEGDTCPDQTRRPRSWDLIQRVLEVGLAARQVGRP